ncbi:12288_t:CDS:10 [Ambispora gerdemannii]|uniref:12288_t:CDS:1 n=1 Tax=Ambispora gerdemannii TaxID=144530 RepID=A0A9N8ZCG2_9GLOM|nr:12288_t:CDS:10 [Ambispora gerdemannii]
MGTRVYIGRLARDARERDVEKLFRGYGSIREIKLMNGFGFVEFRDHRDADDVVYTFNGKTFMGENRFAPPQRNPHYRLIVENLSSSCSWQDLKDLMRKAGEVTFADCHKDRDGEGVVEFSSYEDMKNAIRKLDDTELKGKRIILREAPDNDTDRERDRRSSRRSRSRSRTPQPDPDPELDLLMVKIVLAPFHLVVCVMTRILPPKEVDPEAVNVFVRMMTTDFEPGAIGRLVTAGGDSNVRMWKVTKSEKTSPRVEFLSTLNRHTAPVNVVRFAPAGGILASAGDDGNIILWSLCEDQEPKHVSLIGNSEGDSDHESESWRVKNFLRGSSADIYDLAWSPDGKYIITGSIDNTARIWNVNGAGHSHYVQGVAWDPLGKYIATQSSDRSVHIYSYQIQDDGSFTITDLGKNLNYRRDVIKDNNHNNSTTTDIFSVSSLNTVSSPPPKTTPSKPYSKSFRMYRDETLKSFFRRLTFTPDGSLLLTPAAIYRNSAANNEQQQTTRIDSEAKNAVYLLPIACLKGFEKSSICVKCSPILYKLRVIECSSSPSDIDASLSKMSITEHSKTSHTKFLDLPYRIIYAVATQDAVFIYDTQQLSPLAMVSNLHYATFTDVTWSMDGNILIITSADGFCSALSFREGELGEPYNKTITNETPKIPSTISNIPKDNADVNTIDDSLGVGAQSSPPADLSLVSQDRKNQNGTNTTNQPNIDQLLQTPSQSPNNQKRIAPTLIKPLDT